MVDAHRRLRGVHPGVPAREEDVEGRVGLLIELDQGEVGAPRGVVRGGDEGGAALVLGQATAEAFVAGWRLVVPVGDEGGRDLGRDGAVLDGEQVGGVVLGGVVDELGSAAVIVPV